MNSGLWHLLKMYGSESEGVFGVLLNREFFAKEGLSTNSADASEQNRSSDWNGKRYWPNTRSINRLKMGELVVSKNQ